MNRTLLAVIALSPVLIAGCGGGGSDTDPAPSPPPLTHPVGVKVNGIQAGTLVLRLTTPSVTGRALQTNTNGEFEFDVTVADGASYTIVISTTPEDHVCTIANATGTATAPVDDVEVTCDVIQSSVSGLAQKGPFEIGAEVVIHELDEDLIRTGRTIETLTTDARGGFETDIDFITGVAEVVVTGRYFDELRNVMTTEPVTLRGFVNFTVGGSGETVVNAVSEIVHDRTVRLVRAGGLAFDDARAQARREVFDAFGLPYTDAEIAAYPDILAGEGLQELIVGLLTMGTNDEDFFATRIDVLGGDLTDDGVFDSSGSLGSPQVIDATQVVDALAAYAAAHGITDANPPYVAHMLGEHDVELSITGIEGPGLVVRLEGFESVAIPEDGEWLLATVPTGTYRDIEIVSVPAEPPQYCTLNSPGVFDVQESLSIAGSCYRPSAYIHLRTQGLHPETHLNFERENGFVGSRAGDGVGPFGPALFLGDAYGLTVTGGVNHARCAPVNGSGVIDDAAIEDIWFEIVVECEPRAIAYVSVSGVPDGESALIALNPAGTPAQPYPNGTWSLQTPLFVGDDIDAVIRTVLPAGWAGGCQLVEGEGLVTEADIEAGRVEIGVECTAV